MRANVVILAVSAVIVCLGAFMPWVKLGIISASGTDGDGVITLLLAVVAGGLILIGAGRKSSTWLSGALLLVAGGVVAIAVYDMANIQHEISTSDNIFAAHATIGEGLYATFLGGLGLLLGTVLGAFSKNNPARQAVSELPAANPPS
jgi:hypothetical protein